jgi:hypothetical protein
MTKFFNLDCLGTRFTVLKLSLFNLFEHQRDLFDTPSYEVQSSVPLGIFEVFVDAREMGTKVAVTKENASAISLLAKEFWLEDLLSKCSALRIASAPEVVAPLSGRISKLEDQLSSQLLTLSESITNQDRQLESLSSVIHSNSATLRTEIVQSLVTEFETGISKCEGRNKALVARIDSI